MGLLDRLIRKSDPSPAKAASSPTPSEPASPERRPQKTDSTRASQDSSPAHRGASDTGDAGSGEGRRRRRRRGGRGRGRGGAGARRDDQSANPDAVAPTSQEESQRPPRDLDQDQPRQQDRDQERPREDAQSVGEREPRRRRRAGSRDSDDSPREDRGRGESGRDSTRRDEGRREDTRRDERRDDTRQSDSRAALDRSPRNGSRSSAAARKALTSGGYQLPPLNIVDAIDPADYPPAFRELGLSDRALAVMASLGFDAPTPIQEEAVPMMLDGHDVVGQAQTGTGKTLAFGLLIVERLDPELRQVQAIVLVPTRELAQQVFGVLEFLAEAMGLRAMPLVGGRKLNDDFDNLEKRPQIVVGTPGRIIDHLNRGSLDLGEVRVAVLDEADRMLDIGFEPDMRRILSRCPDNRQTALFSATIPTAIKTLIWRYMHEPEHIQIEPEQATAREIYQRYFEVAEQDKLKALSELLPEMQGRTLIFCNMKVTVDRLVSRLQDRNILAEAIHGDLDQRKRDRVMERFRAGELQFLVATNVASRGLDIPDLNHVVNFDLPQNADEYVHRVGRTGRAGREGSAITFVSEWDYDSFEAIKKLAGDDLQPGDLSLYAGSR